MTEEEARYILSAHSGFSIARQNSILQSESQLLKTLGGAYSFLKEEEKSNFEQLFKTPKYHEDYIKLKDDGIKILLIESDNFPKPLRSIQDPPHLLYVKGTLPHPETAAIAMVGSRKASAYGIKQAYRFAENLSEAGFLIISGLASGIDSSAMTGALRAGASSVGVLGTGIDRVYPSINKRLFEQVEQKGCIVTEFPPGAKPLRHHFPYRNRIISGWSIAVFVIEASIRSGSLVTSRWALEQGKEIFALPGPVDQEGASGCHQLIREGAFLAHEPLDIIDHFPTQVQPQIKKDAEELSLPQIEGLSRQPSSLESLAELNQCDERKMSIELMKLQAKGLVQQWPGARYSLVEE